MGVVNGISADTIVSISDSFIVAELPPTSNEKPPYLQHSIVSQHNGGNANLYSHYFPAQNYVISLAYTQTNSPCGYPSVDGCDPKTLDGFWGGGSKISKRGLWCLAITMSQSVPW